MKWTLLAASDTRQMCASLCMKHMASSATPTSATCQRESYLLTPFWSVIEMIWWTGLAPCKFAFLFPGSVTYTFLVRAQADVRQLVHEAHGEQRDPLFRNLPNRRRLCCYRSIKG